MFIQSILSCRQGYEKLKQRLDSPDGIGPQQGTLDVGLHSKPVFVDIQEAIERFEIIPSRVDHDDIMRKLDDDTELDPYGRLVLTPRGSAGSWSTSDAGKIVVRWSSDIPLEDGSLESVKSPQMALPSPPALIPLIEQVWRDLFPGWQDTSVQGFAVNGPAMNVGLIKHGVALNLMLGRSMIDAWLFQRVPVAVRRNNIDLAVGIFIQGPRQNSHYLNRILRPMSGGFSRAEHNLTQLQPISLEVPFVLIGLSPQHIHTPKFTELIAERAPARNPPAIERVIEVPAQYQQAVLGILGYFGTYLQQIAPECAEAATIRIEQGAGFLRLVVEAENGVRHMIERAFEDYQGVVRGELSVSTLPLSPIAAAELKNELRFAQARIDFQKDIILAQGLEIKSLRELSLGLARRSVPDITVHVSNVAQASSTANSDIRNMADDLAGLASMLRGQKDTEAVAEELCGLEAAIESAAERKDELAKPLSKLREILVRIQTGGSSLHAAIQKTAGAVEAVQKLARRYNAIAEWCGLPQVPRALAGSGEG
ncbi:hypothetical protein [Achromobacter mucicolens]|uniref:hypothetical protein n=1 Tax=Achromobacter mucicolens TaxID=1389922 RepID=UPI001CBB6C5F|nr:hypothetical protein [Achromobacter mucicolens]UAN02011.1 hypothetical protein K9D24_24025 [Achromobacter mucicolens]